MHGQSPPTPAVTCPVTGSAPHSACCPPPRSESGVKSSSFPESRTLLFQSLPFKAPQLVRGPRHSAVLEGHRWFSRCHIILSLCIWDCYPSYFRVPKAPLPPPLRLNLVTAAPRLARALPCTLSQPAQHSLQPSTSSGVPLRGSCRSNE